MDARRPSSFQIKKWGLVHGWLAAVAGREVTIQATMDGMTVRVLDPGRASIRETIGVDEDPSGAAWRAIARIERDQ